MRTPFTKLLVANRGEIALRVMRTANAMGYGTVAVFSTADRDALHVRLADEAVPIGEALPAQSYLNISAIIEAARQTGADAVHPGYGFLAENAEFARACHEAGLVFVGPSAEAIAAMGNKAGAKRLMIDAGVPCIPGYQGDDQTEARMVREASAIGYPVMIKATGGGGGRGMRLVTDESAFPAALRSAQSEARSAFGSSEVILERALIEPRHIEIQILADRHGNVIHLGERDCSVQRRHQKVIEEAPSPAVNPELRSRMGETAVRAAKAIGYEGAGTLEFLLDAAGHYYFMEMNTRLQVEHPVTEAITGLDLVELQLRIASGEVLGLGQEDVCFSGHAIEVRLCAEAPAQSFMPQSGRMALWQMPATARVEHALESGSEISPFYDSMIAKIVSHGIDRNEARRKLAHALENTRALGVPTNQSFLLSCLRHEVFAAGGATTGFIGTYGDSLLSTDPEIDRRAAVIAAVIIFRGADGTGRPGCQTIPDRLTHSLNFRANESACLATLASRGSDIWNVTIDGRSFPIAVISAADELLRVSCDGVLESVWAVRAGKEFLLQYRGHAYRISDQSRAGPERAVGAGSDGKIRAGMAGRIVAVHASVGDALRKGQPVVTIEAMKMQTTYAAPGDGRLAVLNVSEGDQIDAFRLLAEIEISIEAGRTAAPRGIS